MFSCKVPSDKTSRYGLVVMRLAVPTEDVIPWPRVKYFRPVGQGKGDTIKLSRLDLRGYVIWYL